MNRPLPLASFLALFLLPLASWALPPQASPEARPLDRARWRELTEPLDYGQVSDAGREPRDLEAPDAPAATDPEPERRRRDWLDLDWLSRPWVRALSRVILIGGAAVLLFFLLRALFDQTRRTPRKTPKKAGDEPAAALPIADIEARPEAYDLAAYIREAEHQGRFGLAFRLAYRQLLLALAERGLIVRRRGKPNRAYLRELQGQPVQGPMRSLTLRFEEVVYGGLSLPEGDYRDLRATGDRLLREIETPAKAPLA